MLDFMEDDTEKSLHSWFNGAEMCCHGYLMTRYRCRLLCVLDAGFPSEDLLSLVVGPLTTYLGGGAYLLLQLGSLPSYPWA